MPPDRGPSNPASHVEFSSFGKWRKGSAHPNLVPVHSLSPSLPLPSPYARPGAVACSKMPIPSTISRWLARRRMNAKSQRRPERRGLRRTEDRILVRNYAARAEMTTVLLDMQVLYVEGPTTLRHATAASEREKGQNGRRGKRGREKFLSPAPQELELAQ